MQRSRSNTKRAKTVAPKTRISSSTRSSSTSVASSLGRISVSTSTKSYGSPRVGQAGRAISTSSTSHTSKTNVSATKRSLRQGSFTSQVASIATIPEAKGQSLTLHSVKARKSTAPETSSPVKATKNAFSSNFDYKNPYDADDEYRDRYNKYFSNLKPGLEQYGSHDGFFEAYKHAPEENDGRNANYMVMASTKAMYAGLGRASVSKLLAHMQASADVLALASIEVDLSAFEEGTTTTLKWRGKPVFVKHRTPEEIASAVKDDNASNLIDPEKDSERTQKANWLVVVGICTHLGCVPIPNAGEYAGGFFCPCHGSHYDTSGRIRLGPAPLNLEVPPYRFIDDNTVFIG